MTAYTDDDVTADRPDHDYCAWCGWSRVRDDSDEDALLLHIMECPKHPLRFGSSKRDAAIAERALREAADWLRRPENLYGNLANDFDEWRAEQVNP